VRPISYDGVSCVDISIEHEHPDDEQHAEQQE
jgi:hypothetical protein